MRPARKVLIDGVSYNSVASAAAKLDISVGFVQRRLNSVKYPSYVWVGKESKYRVVVFEATTKERFFIISTTHNTRFALVRKYEKIHPAETLVGIHIHQFDTPAECWAFIGGESDLQRLTGQNMLCKYKGTIHLSYQSLASMLGVSVAAVCRRIRRGSVPTR